MGDLLVVTYRDGLPAHRRSPIQVLIKPGPVSINYTVNQIWSL